MNLAFMDLTFHLWKDGERDGEIVGSASCPVVPRPGEVVEIRSKGWEAPDVEATTRVFQVVQVAYSMTNGSAGFVGIESRSASVYVEPVKGRA